MFYKCLNKINSLLKIMYSVNALIIYRFIMGFYTEFGSNKIINFVSKIVCVLLNVFITTKLFSLIDYNIVSSFIAFAGYSIIYLTGL